jgi:hypothetical protein
MHGNLFLQKQIGLEKHLDITNFIPRSDNITHKVTSSASIPNYGNKTEP